MMNIYEIKNYTNFSILTDEQKESAIIRLLSLFNTLNKLRLIVYRDTIDITFSNITTKYPLYRVFIETDEYLEDYNLPDEYRVSRVTGLPYLNGLIREYSNYIKFYTDRVSKIKVDIDRGKIEEGEEEEKEGEGKIEEMKETINIILDEKKKEMKEEMNVGKAKSNYGKVVNAYYAKVLTLTSLSYTMNPAWISTINSDIVIADIAKVEYEKALNLALRLSSMILATGSRLLSTKAERLVALREALLRHETELFRLSLYAVVFGDTLREVEKRAKEVKRSARQSLVKFEDIPFIQNALFKPVHIKEFYIDIGSLAILYPFVSSDLLELEGVLLGVNMNTRAPVIYDYHLRDNYNIVVLASSGAGKSVTAKLFLNRLLMKYRERGLSPELGGYYYPHVYVIDPQGEYEGLASMFTANVIRLSGYEELGLDPYNLFGKEEVADIIADIANADNIARKEIRARSTQVNNIFELYSKLDYAKKYLQDLVEEPMARLFKGNSVLSERNILSLKGTYGEERVSMLLTLALARAWKDITTIEKSIPKVLVIDEGWMLFNMPSTARFINLIARVGRKLNVILLFITQRPEDVIVNEYGRALLDNSDTKILLRNTEVATKKLKEALLLSDEEANYITTASRGEALLMVKNMKFKVMIVPSREELEAFSTTPFT